MFYGTSSLDQTAATFTDLRPRPFGIAYRMLPSAAEAKDVVQETWLRWQNTIRSAICHLMAFLALITRNLSINAFRPAWARGETSIGPWLPEPVEAGIDPAAAAEQGESLGDALLLVLKKLTPAQRAADALREAFLYPNEEIAELIQLSPANVRQLVSRARKHVAGGRRAPPGAVRPDASCRPSFSPRRGT
jgi:RNA polymerase sigma-70 factor (ECF subfamily)